MQSFLDQLTSLSSEDELLDFCRKRVIHGTPFVFDQREDDYYEFRKKIADHIQVNYFDVMISGSAKLGFSPVKKKAFDLDSDIDVSIVSTALFDRIMGSIFDYQMALRQNRKAVSSSELSRYHQFLEYGAMGWMRPDLLPTSFRVDELKREWFEFFKSISNGKSEVGNYKVSAGVFKSYRHLETYVVSGLQAVKTGLIVGSPKT